MAASLAFGGGEAATCGKRVKRELVLREQLKQFGEYWWLLAAARALVFFGGGEAATCGKRVKHELVCHLSLHMQGCNKF